MYIPQAASTFHDPMFHSFLEHSQLPMFHSERWEWPGDEAMTKVGVAWGRGYDKGGSGLGMRL